MPRRRWKVELACGHGFLMLTESGRPPAPRYFGCDCTLPLVEALSIEEDREYDAEHDDRT